MDYRQILKYCANSSWQEADLQLRLALKKQPDSADIYGMAAHIALRKGNHKIARWLIEKAQSLKVDNIFAAIEDVCVNFYVGSFEIALAKLNKKFLKHAEKDHPIHIIDKLLSAMFALAEEKDLAILAENAVERVVGFLKKGDLLSACLVARATEIYDPAKPDSFAALGFFNFNAGFYKNADRNFHEAIFRGTKYAALVNLNHFFLFCRQHRYDDAINIALNIEKANYLDITGHALLLEMMLRSGKKVEVIEGRLAKLEPHIVARKEVNPLLEVVKLKLSILKGKTSKEQIRDQLAIFANQANCPAAFLYFYAELLADNNLAKAKDIAARATSLDHLHPDAKNWLDEREENKLNFEFAGIFIPKEHEGTSLPTKIQEELLNIIFLSEKERQLEEWQAFASKHSLYSFEAGAYRILPYLYKLLTAQNQPIAEADLLKGIWKKTYVENALKSKDLINIVKKLNAANIEVVLLKGLANAVQLYGDLGSRPMADIDILISESDLQASHQILTEEGFITNDKLSSDHMRFSYASTYRHNTGGMLDLHWRPCEIFSNKDFAVSDLGAFSEISFAGYKFKSLSPTVNLFCTIIHGVEWNHLSPVRWVLDALLLIEKFAPEISWAKLLRLAEKYGALAILATGLKYLTKYNQAFLPKCPLKLQQEVEIDHLGESLMKIRLRPRHIIANFAEALASLRYYQQRFAFLPKDYFFICGGDQHEIFKSECANLGVFWLPFVDFKQMMKMANSKSKNYNLIVIDANLSCSFACHNVTVN